MQCLNERKRKRQKLHAKYKMQRQIKYQRKKRCEMKSKNKTFEVIICMSKKIITYEF